MVSPLCAGNWLGPALVPRVKNPRKMPGWVVSLRVAVTWLALELMEQVAWAWPAPARSESATSTVTWSGIE